MMTPLLALLAGALQDPAGPPEAPRLASFFRYEAGRIPIGRVHHYRKSNLDGSSPSRVALYLASETRLEALKWHPGEPGATRVVAEMDWEVASARALRTERIDEHGLHTPVAELEASADRRVLHVKVGEEAHTCALARFPWHSYDFDFASLNVALRFLADPEGEAELGIVDPVHGPEGVRLSAKGTVVLAYEGSEERNGLACRRYVLDGPGLEERGGSLWVARGEEVFLVAFELDLPDEPGMHSGRLEWLRNETLAEGEWLDVVRNSAAGE
jgi:hypothetical protein